MDQLEIGFSTVRDTSIDAHMDLKISGQLGKQEKIILDHLIRIGIGQSLKEISRATKIEINAVSGRVNALKHKKILVECEKRKCLVTGRRIIPVKCV